MKKLMMLLALATGIGQTIAQQSRVAIIPQPVSVKENPGSYLLPKQIVVDAPNMASLQYTQKWLQHKLTTATGYTMLFTQGKPCYRQHCAAAVATGQCNVGQRRL
jgi:hypothetical protein